MTAWAVLPFIFWPRDYDCQRCGAALRMSGPIIIWLYSHYLGGAGGDKGLYCEKHGHILTSKYDPNIDITDWRYHRDSYSSEQAYRNDSKHKIYPMSEMQPINSIKDL